MAILHQRMAHERQPGWLTAALAHQTSVRIGLGLVRLVAAALASKVAPAVVVPVVFILVLAPKALERSPCLDQRAVDAEVLLAHEVTPVLANRGEERRGDI